MAIVPKEFMNSVVSIGIYNTENEILWIGTGFFAIRKIGDGTRGRPFLITNKHVVSGKSSLVIRMIEMDSGRLRNIDVPLYENGKPIYHLHQNEKIDISVIPLNGGFIEKNKLDFHAFDIDDNAMGSTELQNNGVDEGSLIHMLGFPMGLVIDNSSTPICRLGCIARMDESQIKSSFNILVDIQNFPGNSGSPIIYRPEAIAIQGTRNLMKSVLIGIVHSYIPYRESLINSQTHEIVEIRSENSGLALVHPVEYIKEIIDLIEN